MYFIALKYTDVSQTAAKDFEYSGVRKVGDFCAETQVLYARSHSKNGVMCDVHFTTPQRGSDPRTSTDVCDILPP